MKKITAVSLILLLTLALFSLAGCGSDESALKKIEEEGVLVMGTNAEFPPFEYRDENGEVAGFDVAIAQEIADSLGAELVIEDMDFGSIISAINSGKVDLGLAGMSVTPDRLENVDFSDAYFNASQVIVVQKTNTEITSSDDLENTVIGVQEGTTGDLEVSEVEGVEVMRFKKGIDAVVDLRNGKIDAVVIDALPAKVFVEKNDDIMVLDDYFTKEEYAIAIKKGDSEFVKHINGVIQDLKDSGRYQEIYDTYIEE